MASAAPLPSELWWISRAEAVDAWVRAAKAGDEYLYAHCEMLPPLGAAAARVRWLVERGAVLAFQRRAGPGYFDYVVRRSRIGLGSAGVIVRPTLRLIVDRDAEAALLLDLIGAAARAGRSCPSHRALAAAAGIPLARTRALQSCMEQEGTIQVERVPAAWPEPVKRIVTIVATGERTA